jgi:AraC-like DNA-binding protein
MILAPVQDRALRSIVRRAALPEEDVFVRIEDVQEALRSGYPRILVRGQEDFPMGRSFLGPGPPPIPLLTIRDAVLKDWASTWAVRGTALSRVDDSALRLRRLMADVAGSSDWVGTVFSDLTQILGRGLPVDFRGFARRVLEFPGRYVSLEQASIVCGLTPGALKGRFRRRGLPSPTTHLRWLRLLRAGQLLSDPSETTLSVSSQLGFTSDGNFCRWVTATSGMNPTDLREWNGRLLLLIRMADACFPHGTLEHWKSLGGIFVSRVA